MSVIGMLLPVFKGIAICAIGDEGKLATESIFVFP